MRSPRRGALRPVAVISAFVVPAVVWSLVNIWAYDAAMRASRTRAGVIDAWIAGRAAAQGRPVPQPPQDHMWELATSWATRWQLIGPGLALLGGAALLAVLLRRSLRGGWWVAAVLVPAFAGGFSSAAEAGLHAAAGFGVTVVSMPQPTFAAQGLNLPDTHGPTWLVWAMAAVGVATMMGPAALTKRGVAAAAVMLRGVRAPLAAGALAGLAVLVGQALNTDGSGYAWRGPLGAAFLAIASCHLLRVSTHRTRSGAALAAANAALIVGNLGVATGELASAAAYGALLVVTAAVVLLPWAAWRTRINDRDLATDAPASV